MNFLLLWALLMLRSPRVYQLTATRRLGESKVSPKVQLKVLLGMVRVYFLDLTPLQTSHSIGNSIFWGGALNLGVCSKFCSLPKDLGGSGAGKAQFAFLAAVFGMSVWEITFSCAKPVGQTGESVRKK